MCMPVHNEAMTSMTPPISSAVGAAMFIEMLVKSDFKGSILFTFLGTYFTRISPLTNLSCFQQTFSFVFTDRSRFIFI